MGTDTWILCGLAAFDLLILALFALLLHSSRVLDRKGRMFTAIALSGFVFHAMLFFAGAILFLQLATLAVIYIALALWPAKAQPIDGAHSRP